MFSLGNVSLQTKLETFKNIISVFLKVFFRLLMSEVIAYLSHNSMVFRLSDASELPRCSVVRKLKALESNCFGLSQLRHFLE